MPPPSRSETAALRHDAHLKLAETWGKQLHEIMDWPGPMTHRQFVVAKAWLRLEQNRPSRSDVYQMQTALEVRRVPHTMFGKKPCESQLKDMVIRFKDEKGSPGTNCSDSSPTGGLTKDQLVEAEKAIWRARIRSSARAGKQQVRKEDGNTKRKDKGR